MITFSVHSISEDQETAIRIFLDALHVDHKATEANDDTEYLLSSPANATHLQKSIEQAQNGEVVKLGLDDIWKP